MTFGTLTVSYNHPTCLVRNISIIPKGNPASSQHSLSIGPTPTPWQPPDCRLSLHSVILGYFTEMETCSMYFFVAGFFYRCPVFLLLFLHPHPRICLLILEREEAGEREREKQQCERSIDELPPCTCPLLGIKPITPWSKGRRSSRLSLPARAWPACFTRHHVLQIHSRVSDCRSFLWLQNTALCGRARFSATRSLAVGNSAAVEIPGQVLV